MGINSKAEATDMSNSYKRVLGVVGCVVVLGGCSLSRQATMGSDFGNAVQANNAAQIIDPKAGQQEPVVGTVDGQKTEQTLQRYRKEKGKAPTQRLIIDVGSTGTSSSTSQ
jgi:hypothetical protein